jgi:hypothetical protein
MKPKLITIALGLALSVGVPASAVAQTPASITTPDTVEASIGKLQYKDGAPSKETVTKAYDYLDLMHGVEAFVNAYQGASVAAIFKGMEDAGVPNNTALIFSELMDAKSEGGKYLFVPPDYKGELPGSGYYVQKMCTTRATMLGRAFLENNDPKPVVALIKKTLKIYPYLSGGYGTSIGSALQGKATLARTPDHKLDWAFLRPEEPAKFIEGTGKVMNTVPPNDFSYFELINDLVQKEPVGALDPEIMGSLAAIGIIKGKPFNPDAHMKKILTDAAAIGTAAARTLDWRPRTADGFSYYPNSTWIEPLFVGGYNFETPPPDVSATGTITVNPPTGARTLNARTSFFFYATYINPAMCMRLTGIGSQYLGAFVDSNGEYFDGGKTYKVTLPKDIPAEKFWSLTVYDNQTRSMLDTPQRYPRAGSQSYPTAAAEPNADGSTTVYFSPKQPDGVKPGNWIQTTSGKGWSVLLRFYSPLEPFFTKEWRPSEIELVR